jgi:hypothetical protein
MIKVWAIAFGVMLASTAQAAQPPSSCHGALSDPEVYAKVKDAVTYAMVVHRGSESPPDEIFGNVSHWLEGMTFWLDSGSTLYTRLQKIRSEMGRAETREQITACYPDLNLVLHPEAARRAVATKQAEAAERAEAARQAEAAKRLEIARRREEAARQVWESGAPLRAQREEAAREAWEATAPARGAEAAKREEDAQKAWEAGAPARAAQAAELAERGRQALEAARQAQAGQVRAAEAMRKAWEAEAPARKAQQAAEQEEAAKRAEVAKQSEAAKQTEEATKQREEAATKARQAAASARAQAKEAGRKINATLEVIYANYSIIMRCHDEREGDHAPYISETQFAEAQVALSAIEQKLKRADIDLAALRKQANSVANDSFISVRNMPKAGQPGDATSLMEMFCKGTLQQFMQIDPEYLIIN